MNNATKNLINIHNKNGHLHNGDPEAITQSQKEIQMKIKRKINKNTKK